MADAVDALRKLALSLADVVESTACAGTAIEQASFQTRGKSFLFAQRKNDIAIVRLKLAESLAAAETANQVEVGKGGWTTCRVPLAKAPSATLKRWVRESYALSATPVSKGGHTKRKRKKVSAKKKTTANKQTATKRRAR